MPLRPPLTSAACCALPLSLHASTTCAPRRASCWAVANPMPALPPVTSATWGRGGGGGEGREGKGAG